MRSRFETLTDLLDPKLSKRGFDTVIDVRSPAEFAEDHIPGAINLPALSNEERAEVGTIYVQVSPFKARKLGAALVARNVAAHLEGPLKDHDGGWRPLVYCWRGGQRSGSFASILSQIGWRAGVVEGGYQAFRGLVHTALYEADLPHKLILLDGNTGTAKTDLLHRLSDMDVQVLDLEGLANHRGSILGDMPGGQPSQKAFETVLACALERLDPNRPVLVEAESNKIGARTIPPSLWVAMKAAPRIEVSAPVSARAAFLASTYRDLDGMAKKLDILRKYRGKTVDGWQTLLAAGDREGLAEALIDGHYDATYRASRAKHAPVVLQQFEADTLGPSGRAALADQIAGWVHSNGN